MADSEVHRRAVARRSSVELVYATVREMEDKHGLRNVWGYTETPALQMMECIDKIKQAMYEKADEEEVNVKTFYALLAAVLVIILFSLLLWEFIVRPQLQTKFAAAA